MSPPLVSDPAPPNKATQMAARRWRNNFTRRRKAMIKKNNALHEDFGAVVYTWVYLHGRHYVYKSDAGNPPSFTEVMEHKYPAADVVTPETLGHGRATQTKATIGLNQDDGDGDDSEGDNDSDSAGRGSNITPATAVSRDEYNPYPIDGPPSAEGLPASDVPHNPSRSARMPGVITPTATPSRAYGNCRLLPDDFVNKQDAKRHCGFGQGRK